MATHFARGILTEGHLISVRLPSQCHQEARNIPLIVKAVFCVQRFTRRTDVHAVWHWRIAGNRHPAER